MSVDLEAIAQRGRCDVSSLRLAIPLLEQGYSPPFLARYRRDELGGVDEASLWVLASALHNEQQVQQRREELVAIWEKTTLRDPAINHALKKSNSLRMLNRLGRRLKHETGDAVDDATRLAVRVLNPQQGDGADLKAIAAKVEGIENADAAIAKVDAALAKRLAGDPRMVAAAVRWLARNAKIHIAKIHDPHVAGEEATEQPQVKAEKTTDSAAGKQAAKNPEQAPKSEQATQQGESSPAASPSSDDQATAAATDGSGKATASTESPVQDATADTESPQGPGGAESTATVEQGLSAEPPSASSVATDTPPTGDEAVGAPVETPAQTTAAEAGSETQASNSSPPQPAADGQTEKQPESAKQADAGKQAETEKPGGKSSGDAPKPKQTSKKQKKVSPRQRRRRWLVSVLKPLEGKRFAGDKLSAFQIVMLGRALRSQVAQCAFQYDASKLVAELQRAAGSMNRNFEEKLRQIVLEHEGEIREAAEAAWWDDLHEKASARLVTITADHLRRHVNRGAVDARVVMAIDAVGPRTAATSIVCSDGRILHNEDLPCQLSSALRTQAVTRIGELIHSFHVDLIVISNGPARRATMIALGDLIAQSPEKSVHWTLADRSGADVYAGNPIANEEMRSTPRRFRAAAWLAFSVLQPAQALAKIDPLKLRLSSFQRELSDEAMSEALENVMTSGASRGGVDVNSAPVSWLERIPGVTSEVAQAIDQVRRDSLFASREALSELAQWESVAGSRQALPFLRVFDSEETLDGTLIHPDDYPLAKKLASALEIELPPKAPPGYVAPDFSEPEDPTTKAKIAEAPTQAKEIPVEDFTSAGDRAKEFSIDESQGETAAEPLVAEPTADTTSESQDDPQPSSSDDASSVEADATAAEPVAGSDDAAPSPQQEETPQESPESTPSESTASAETPAIAIAKESIPEPVRRAKPEAAKVDKCIKEWQIGARRAHQLVQWLCDPFGDSDTSGSAPAVLSTIPSSKNLKPGDMVIGVVVGVMPFGVFVELAPDCSGLIHVSRVSDSYVEDLHEAVQVGDVITAWVTGIDEKRRRVALTAISPEREAELEEARRSRDHRSHQGGSRRGGRGAGRGHGDADTRAGAGGQARGDAARGGGGGRGAGGRGGAGGRESGGRGSGGRAGSQARGGAGRGKGGRAGGRGRDKKPESYRVVSKAEAKPITDAMQKGEEPMRSFGDLMQFFGKATSSKEATSRKDETSSPQKQKASDSDSSGKPPAALDETPADAGSTTSQADANSGGSAAPANEAPEEQATKEQVSKEQASRERANDASGAEAAPPTSTPSNTPPSEPPSPADKA